ncbi:hypothetical protein KY348_00630 [Candidatus Woesearchaeota archaeon]|nr:hypothetical protein [Candidatus Woesearchaeota archaeon]
MTLQYLVYGDDLPDPTGERDPSTEGRKIESVLRSLTPVKIHEDFTDNQSIDETILLNRQRKDYLTKFCRYYEKPSIIVITGVVSYDEHATYYTQTILGTNDELEKFKALVEARKDKE